MADLAGVAASHEANILDIHHGSPFTSAQYRETEIDLTVELAGPDQAQALLQAFVARGYQACSFSLE